MKPGLIRRVERLAAAPLGAGLATMAFAGSGLVALVLAAAVLITGRADIARNLPTPAVIAVVAG